MRIILTRFALTTAAAMATAMPAAATPPAFEDLDRLDARIALFLGGTTADAGQRAQPVDRRLRLARCAEDAEFDAPAMGAIAVRCASPAWRLRVPLTGGTALIAETVVRRGDAVELLYNGSGFGVTTTATALEDGRDGGLVRVKSPTSAAVVTARVQGPGRVSIGD